MTQATLLVIQGTDQGTRFELTHKDVGIGRGVWNEFRILDTEVSRDHALIQYRDGHYFISDRGSSNGSFVNGRLIQNQALANGDQIHLGHSVLLFNLISSESSALSVAEQIDLIEHEQERIVSPPQIDAAIKASFSSSEQTLANLQALYRITEETVSPSISLDLLLQHILDLTINVVGADRGCMLIADTETGGVVPTVFSQKLREEKATRMPVSRSIVDYVLAQEQGVLTSDAQSDQRFEAGQSILQAGIREAMCVPMHGRYNLMGVIYVDITTPPEQALLEGNKKGKFNEEQLRLLVAIGRQSALAVENNRYQEALLKAERLATMGQTIAMLSHHIKNILQGVRGGSYLIDLGLKESKTELVHKGWNIVEKNQTKIYNLVMDMLTFSKERQPDLKPSSLNESVQDVCELMEARAENCGVTFCFQPAEDIPESSFDPEGIQRAVLNIVTNAIDAVEEQGNGSVLIETGYDNDEDFNFIRVTDNGPGIPDDQLQRIFNVFESTKGSRGTGLGLAVSQKILREHGGDIVIESELGKGCRFTLGWHRVDNKDIPSESNTKGE
ncbi:sensor protein atoS [hydrothermal vent metagenome]|uniref:Sensor protein atoS n=1 Tax=hydrothermal vent metagenome TaxID=652676 RepID=A0A3B1DSN0_9ZZZZ